MVMNNRCCNAAAVPERLWVVSATQRKSWPARFVLLNNQQHQPPFDLLPQNCQTLRGITFKSPPDLPTAVTGLRLEPFCLCKSQLVLTGEWGWV